MFVDLNAVASGMKKSGCKAFMASDLTEFLLILVYRHGIVLL